MSDGAGHIPHTFSSIDDGLNLLLADLKEESAQSPLLTRVFTPSVKFGYLSSADGQALQGRLAPSPGTAAGPSTSSVPLFGSNSSCQGALGSPLMLPSNFIPVPLPTKPRSGSGSGSGGGKLPPGVSAPPQALSPTHHAGCFAIPSYNRPLTQLDFISPEDLEDGCLSLGVRGRDGSGSGAGTAGCGAAGTAAASAAAAVGGSNRARGSSFAEFGELADESRLGDLPSDEDLRMLLFDGTGMTPAAAMPLGAASGAALRGGSSAATANTSCADVQLSHMFVLGQQHGQQQQLPAFLQQDGRGGHGGGSSSSAGGFGTTPFDVPASQQLPHLPRPAPFIRIRTEATGAASYVDGIVVSGRQSSLGSLKRRVDAIDLDASPSSARSSKRHSGEGWEEVGPAGGSSGLGSTPRSTTPRDNVPGVVLMGSGGSGSGSGPSRFSLELGRQRSSRSSSDDSDPAYTPGRERSRLASRQQQVAATATGDGEEEGVAQVQQYRGVSRHRLTQRWEASLWLNGRQLYLGGFNSQEDAAHAYDLAALACKGLDAQINFPADSYTDQLREIEGYTRDEVVAYVRRRSSAFSRGRSRYRGVSGHDKRWEARIGSFNGRKNVSFGVFESEEAAARQYDRALILEKGRAAKTNFPIRDYEREVVEYESWAAAKRRGEGVSQWGDGEAAHSYTLPRNREATPDEKKRAAVIYADALRRALQEPLPARQQQRGGR